MATKENEIIFEQELLKMRVIHTENDIFDIEVAGLDVQSIGTEIEDETVAKSVVNGLLEAYKAGLAQLQTDMLEALTRISDEQKAPSLFEHPSA